MEFREMLQKRRSIRDFEEREVPLSVIQEILREACCAPSAMNGQPWEFIIVTRKEVIKRLSDESKKNLLTDLEQNPDSPIRRYEEILRDEKLNVFYNAPCLVYIVGHKDVRSLDVDCTLCACYFMMSAAARGLGTCWIGLGCHIRETGIRKEIGIPEDYRIIAPIIVGYPKVIPEVSERNPPKVRQIIS